MMKKPAELWVVKYETKWGIEVYPAFIKGKKPPELTNRLLKKVGLSDPELGMDEAAEWQGPWRLKDLPRVVGPRDWYPGAKLAIALLVVYSPKGQNTGIIPAWVLAKAHAPHVTQELVQELEPLLDEDDVDLERSEWIGPELVDQIPRV